MRLSSRTVAMALLAAAPIYVAGSAAAAPLGASLGMRDAVTSAAQSTPDQAATLQTVQWRGGRGWGGRGWGGRGWWGPGFAAGAIIGGAVAATQPWYGYGYDYGPYGYDYGPYGYDYGPGYSTYGYDPGYTQYSYSGPGYGSGGAGYCAQRYRSYDPASGTYLGYDGLRHPCP